jgi:hypothetical protein
MTLPSQLINGYPGTYQGRQVFASVNCDLWVKTPLGPNGGLTVYMYWAAGTSTLVGIKVASPLGDATMTISAWQIGAPNPKDFSVPKECSKRALRSVESKAVQLAQLCVVMRRDLYSTVANNSCLYRLKSVLRK